MPSVKYVGPLDTPFGVSIDHWVYDFDPVTQRELKLPSEREVVMLLEREPDLWEVVSEKQASIEPTGIDTGRTPRRKTPDAESVADGAQ